GGRLAAARTLESRGHNGRGAAAVLRRRDARNADAHDQPLRRTQEIRTTFAVPALAVFEGAAGGTGRTFRRQIQNARHAGVGEKSFCGDARGHFISVTNRGSRHYRAGKSLQLFYKSAEYARVD